MLFGIFSQAAHKAKTDKKNCPVEGGDCNSYSFKKEKGGGDKVHNCPLALL